MQRHLHRSGWLLIPLALLSTFGCTASPVSVKGHLAWDDGKPVSGASVRFLSTSGTNEAVGQTDKDGDFTLISGGGASGVVPGDYKVVVTKAAAGPVPKVTAEPKNPEEMAKLMKGVLTQQSKSPPKVTDPVPTIYGSEKTTTLTAKVEKADQKIELKISRK